MTEEEYRERVLGRRPDDTSTHIPKIPDAIIGIETADEEEELPITEKEKKKALEADDVELEETPEEAAEMDQAAQETVEREKGPTTVRIVQPEPAEEGDGIFVAGTS